VRTGLPVCRKERKGRVFIWRLFAPRYIQSAQAWITQFYLQTTPCLLFLRGVHQMSPPQQLRQQASNCSSLLIYRLQKDERLSWPSWLTYSGWLTHISGHPSAASRAQDSESTSAKDQCYIAGPRNQPIVDDRVHTELSVRNAICLVASVEPRGTVCALRRQSI